MTPFSYIALGAGVQSTALILLAIERHPRLLAWFEEENIPFPSYAIFADTGNEPKIVYEHLERLKDFCKEVKYELNVVRFDNIIDRTLRKADGETGFRSPTLPWYINSGAEIGRNGRRGCTESYKVEPMQNFALRRHGIMKGQRRPKSIVHHCLLGITTDEASRMKPASKDWVNKSYPLIFGMGWNRSDCIAYLKKAWPHPVGKSSCIICPFHSHETWKQMKAKQPEEFEMACKFDEQTRNMPGFRGRVYLHRSGEPLRDAVLTHEEDGQDEFSFIEECEGYCGI